jgi:hypothetical protein
MPQDPSSALALATIVDPEPQRCDRVERDRSGIAGPGWFDSSWELQRGLDVKEDWFGEDRLHGWIETFLCGQRTAAGRTASPSESTAIA